MCTLNETHNDDDAHHLTDFMLYSFLVPFSLGTTNKKRKIHTREQLDHENNEMRFVFMFI